VLDTLTRVGKLIEREHFANAAEASLHFSHGGGRTVLTRQRVPYPFHATRTFYLDQARPDFATLYLQSAAGGLYRGDRVALSITAEPDSAAHVTTQAATIVHRTHRFPVEQSTRLEIGEHAFLALTPDPLVLFPGAEISCKTEVTLTAGGCAILTDGISHHDPEGLGPEGLGPEGLGPKSLGPEGSGRAFKRYSNAVVVRDAAGRVLLNDRGAITGEAMFAPSSPLGPYRAVGTVFVLGRGAEHCDADTARRNRLRRRIFEAAEQRGDRQPRARRQWWRAGARAGSRLCDRLRGVDRHTTGAAAQIARSSNASVFSLPRASAQADHRHSKQPQPLGAFQRAERQQRAQRPAGRFRSRPLGRRHRLFALPVTRIGKETAVRAAAARVGAIAPIFQQRALRLRQISVPLAVRQHAPLLLRHAPRKSPLRRAQFSSHGSLRVRM
jgi:urease accessory protein